ncbi:MAG: metal-dependent transcriptional regulator [Clostridia bacterium]|jgi:DtxR family Mn-dependent transcriptional regulator|nr:metal-dependent transcriptional regulator [Clostridia bacterium]MCI9290353.1 metal-dependent transcriptional regulator [Clostridia bacterium]
MSDLRKSGEDYLEAILFIEEEKGIVKSVDIATYLGVSKPSVNKALTILQEMGYVSKPNYSQVTITQEGRKKAKAVAQKHSALTRLLTDVLGVSEEVAEKDACKIEHDISEETTRKLIAFLQKRD